MLDDYAGYKGLFREGVTELACLAPIRRKFFELHQANASPLAAEALRRIGELYAIETRANSVAERAELRQTLSQPRVEALGLWLQHNRKTVANGGGLARAMDYALKRWPAVARYVQNGHYPIDNNPVENAIRPIAITRKIGCSPVPKPPDSVPPPSSPCWRPPAPTALSPSPGLPTRCKNSPPGLIAASTNSCQSKFRPESDQGWAAGLDAYATGVYTLAPPLWSPS